jgi:hypothetical protein
MVGLEGQKIIVGATLLPAEKDWEPLVPYPSGVFCSLDWIDGIL